MYGSISPGHKWTFGELNIWIFLVNKMNIAIVVRAGDSQCSPRNRRGETSRNILKWNQNLQKYLPIIFCLYLQNALSLPRLSCAICFLSLLSFQTGIGHCTVNLFDDLLVLLVLALKFIETLWWWSDRRLIGRSLSEAGPQLYCVAVYFLQSDFIRSSRAQVKSNKL